MRGIEVARRYADALYQVAVEQDAMDATEQELRAVVRGVEGTADFGRFLAHPLISRDEKAELVVKTFPEMSERLANLLKLLIRNRRESYLDLIYDQFVEVRVEAEGLAKIEVTSAKPLTEEGRARLTSRLEEAVGRRVLLEERVDEALIGGARIEMDGRVIDGTVRARLERLRALLGE
ncbi:ATP synthase F1 subunit delta [Candidatus Bipolaricaulota bacterium]